MNITIHRGANQIGGCITEISSDNCRLLVDFGSNLPGSQKAELTEAQILKNFGDNKPAIVIFANTAAMGYFNIEFCPMCGRKLVE